MAALPRWILRVSIWIVAGYVAICIVVWVFQRRIMYFPSTRMPTLPDEEGLRNVTLRTNDDLSIHAWVWEPATPAGTVLLFHGNAGHRGDRMDWMQRIHGMGYRVMVVDYRGYGGSEGSPSEDGLYKDGEAALAWIRAHAPGPIFLAGNSVGSGVAVELATRHEIQGLVLTAPMASAARAGQEAYPFLPVRLLLKDRFENLEKIGRVQAPLLMLHGAKDNIIRIAHAEALLAAAQEPKHLVRLTGLGHNDIFLAGDRYWDPIRAFLDAWAPK